MVFQATETNLNAVECITNKGIPMIMKSKEKKELHLIIKNRLNNDNPHKNANKYKIQNP